MNSATFNAVEFERKWNRGCPVAGHIFHSKLERLPLALHFAIRINEREVISWGPITEGAASAKGHFEISEFSRRYSRVRDVTYADQQVIRENIFASLTCFTGKWDYCVRGWNCEHWARLVATGKPLSYQVKELYFSFGRITGGHFENPDASRVLAEVRQNLGNRD